MAECLYYVEYAGHCVYYKFLHAGTKTFFGKYLNQRKASCSAVQSSQELIALGRQFVPKNSSESFVEYRTLINLTSLELLQYDCCVFHAVSFVYGGKSFLLAAPSGMGKSTQYFNWQKLFPGEITMICGDMPVLERREDGSVWAHPTSWNGKENIGNRICAPLGGIVLLEQGKVNRIAPLSAREAIMPFFKQFIVQPETEEQVHALARLMDQMLRNVPCFKLVNLGDDASTILLRETLTPLAKGELS